VCCICETEPVLEGQSLCIGCRVKANEIMAREFGTIDLRGVRFRDWVRFGWRYRRAFRVPINPRVFLGAVRDGWRKGLGK